MTQNHKFLNTVTVRVWNPLRTLEIGTYFTDMQTGILKKDAHPKNDYSKLILLNKLIFRWNN